MFGFGCESCYDETRATVHVLLGAFGGVAVYQLHAFGAKLFQQYANHRHNNAVDNAVGKAMQLLSLVCNVAAFAEQEHRFADLERALTRHASAVRAAIKSKSDNNHSYDAVSAHARETGATETDRDTDTPGPNYASSPLLHSTKVAASIDR